MGLFPRVRGCVGGEQRYAVDLLVEPVVQLVDALDNPVLHVVELAGQLPELLVAAVDDLGAPPPSIPPSIITARPAMPIASLHGQPDLPVDVPVRSFGLTRPGRAPRSSRQARSS